MAVLDSSCTGCGNPRRKYRGRPPKVDGLSPEDFQVFARLREQRAQAEAQGVPVYALLTNEQPATIARARPATLTDYAPSTYR